ncbi:hypothetical protein R5W23_001053, partial [Gemmata sp. JC673]
PKARSIARAAAVGVWSAAVNPVCRWWLRVAPVGAGAAHRREVRLVVAGGASGHGVSDRWCSAWCRSGLARLVAAGVGGGWPPACRDTVRGSVVAPRMRDAGAGSAEPQRPAQKPNPALHLTPPAGL